MIAAPITYSAVRFRLFNQYVSAAAGALSVVFASFLVHQIGFGGRPVSLVCRQRHLKNTIEDFLYYKNLGAYGVRYLFVICGFLVAELASDLPGLRSP
jgi:hypothetical protein